MRTTIAALTTAGALAVATIAVTTPSAAASVRYASHTVADGSGAPCTQADPCSLFDAVTFASAGDIVQLTADEYYLDRQLDVYADDLTIRGPSGVGTPGSFVAYIIFRDAASGGLPDTTSKLSFFANNTHFERVAITGTADGAAALVGASGAGMNGFTYDRVLIRNHGSGLALLGRGAAVKNSVILQTEASTFGRAAIVSGTISSSTIISRHATAIEVNDSYLALGTGCNLSIRNTLAWGAYANLLTDDSGSGCATVTVDYDYSWIPVASGGSLGGGHRLSIGSTVTSLGHNLADLPVVFDPTSPDDSYIGNWALSFDSPAIDVGCSDAGCTDHDYYGRPRPIAAAHDAGAMEQSLYPQIPSSPEVGSITPNSAALSATIASPGLGTDYAIEIRREGTGDWRSVGTGRAVEPFGGRQVSATAGDLIPEARYETRIRVTNDRGTSTSGVTSFSTASLEIDVTGVKAKVTKKKATVKSKATVNGNGRITQKITTGKGSKKRTVCTVSKQAAAAGTYSLACTLTKKARKQLRSGALKVKVTTTVQPTAGNAASTSSRLTIPRRR
mgnify:CR=1 FL=1